MEVRVIGAADFPPIVEVAGYSIVYAVLGGIVLAAGLPSGSEVASRGASSG